MSTEDNQEGPRKKRCLSPLSSDPDICTPATMRMKCSKCNKVLARKLCSQKACFKCCTDMNCEGHRETREKESIINGTHEINKLANAKRALAIKPGLFRDPAFQYLGETILIWSLSDYLSNTKWREEAIRKSLRNMESRKQGMMVEKESQLRRRQKNGCSDSEVSCEDVRLVASMSSPSKESRKKRFHRIMNELYEKSVDDR